MRSMEVGLVGFSKFQLEMKFNPQSRCNSESLSVSLANTRVSVGLVEITSTFTSDFPKSF